MGANGQCRVHSPCMIASCSTKMASDGKTWVQTAGRARWSGKEPHRIVAVSGPTLPVPGTYTENHNAYLHTGKN